MVRRTPSNLVLVVCAETSTALSVLSICTHLSFEFQFCFRIAFRLVQADQSIDPIASPLTIFVTPSAKYVFCLSNRSGATPSPVLSSVDFARSTAASANYGVESLHSDSLHVFDSTVKLTNRQLDSYHLGR